VKAHFDITGSAIKQDKPGNYVDLLYS